VFGIKKLKSELHRLQAANGTRAGRGSVPTDHPLLSFYVSTTSKLLGSERCSIFILDPGTRRIWLKRGTGVDDRAIEVQIEGSIVGRVITSGQAVIENDLTSKEGAHQQVAHDTGFVTRNMACVPIRASGDGEVVGAVQVLNKREGGFSPADLEELTDLARYLQMTIESIFQSQEIVGAMGRVVKVAQTALVLAATGAIAITAIMVVYVITVVAMGD